jgi:predicted metal-binding membrane protein
MAAMMLPSALPMVLLFGHVASRRTDSRAVLAPTAVFVAGYLAVWSAFGIAAFGLARLVRGLEPGFVAGHGPLVAGAAIVAAGLYQLTPLKRLCLRHCRSPLAFLVRHWRDGSGGAMAMGAAHGAYCVGCCTGLMLILFALGVMSLLWMAVVAALVFAEKVLPAGDRLAPLIAVALVALGLWVAVQP